MRRFYGLVLLCMLCVWSIPARACTPFGQPDDIPVPARYAFDTVAFGAHMALYRPSTREWIIRKDNGAIITDRFAEAQAGDLPVPADYLGRDQVQLALYRPATGEWLIRDDRGSTKRIVLGMPGDIPAPAKYFSRYAPAQIAVFRPSTQEWFVRVDDTGRLLSIRFGRAGDIPVPGDYLGYSQAQFAVFRPSTQEWFILDLQKGQIVTIRFGLPGDRPAPANYLDQLSDQIAVYRPSTGQWLCRLDDGYSSPPGKISYCARSEGWLAFSDGLSEFTKGGSSYWLGFGGGLGARGFNLAAIDLSMGTGALMLPLATFDTWQTRDTGEGMRALIQCLKDLPNGTLILLSVADDAGLNEFDSCTRLQRPWVTDGIKALRDLGSTKIDQYCYRGSWAMVAVKGEGKARAEAVSKDKEAVACEDVSLPGMAAPA